MTGLRLASIRQAYTPPVLYTREYQREGEREEKAQYLPSLHISLFATPHHGMISLLIRGLFWKRMIATRELAGLKCN